MNLCQRRDDDLRKSCGSEARLCFRAVGILVACLVSLVPWVSGRLAHAQDITGRIVGSVTDSSGGTVSDARVTIVNEATQALRQIVTDKNGYFVVDELFAGTYTFTAEKASFKKTIQKDNVLSAGGRLTVDLVLEVGAVTESVVVTAAGDTVNTTSGELSTTVTEQEVKTLASRALGFFWTPNCDENE